MKNLLFTILVVGIVLAEVKAHTPEDKKSVYGTAVMRQGVVFKLFYKGEHVSDVKVKILNEKGETVFTDYIKKTESFIRPYNFSLLPEGDYTIMVNNNESKEILKASYHNGKVETLVHLTKLKTGIHQYVLSIPYKEKKTYTIKIYNESHVLLYEGTEHVENDFAKVYNLENVFGDVVFEVTDSNGVTKVL